MYFLLHIAETIFEMSSHCVCKNIASHNSWINGIKFRWRYCFWKCKKALRKYIALNKIFCVRNKVCYMISMCNVRATHTCPYDNNSKHYYLKISFQLKFRKKWIRGKISTYRSCDELSCFGNVMKWHG